MLDAAADVSASKRRQSSRIEARRSSDEYWLQHNFPPTSVLRTMLDGRGISSGLSTNSPSLARGSVRSEGQTMDPIESLTTAENYRHPTQSKSVSGNKRCVVSKPKKPASAKAPTTTSSSQTKSKAPGKKAMLTSTQPHDQSQEEDNRSLMSLSPSASPHTEPSRPEAHRMPLVLVRDDPFQHVPCVPQNGLSSPEMDRLSGPHISRYNLSGDMCNNDYGESAYHSVAPLFEHTDAFECLNMQSATAAYTRPSWEVQSKSALPERNSPFRLPNRTSPFPTSYPQQAFPTGPPVNCGVDIMSCSDGSMPMDREFSDFDDDDDDEDQYLFMPSLVPLDKKKAVNGSTCNSGNAAAAAPPACMNIAQTLPTPREQRASSHETEKQVSPHTTSNTGVYTISSSSVSRPFQSPPKQSPRKKAVMTTEEAILLADNKASSGRVRRMASKNAKACINALASPLTTSLPRKQRSASDSNLFKSAAVSSRDIWSGQKQASASDSEMQRSIATSKKLAVGVTGPGLSGTVSLESLNKRGRKPVVKLSRHCMPPSPISHLAFPMPTVDEESYSSDDLVELESPEYRHQQQQEAVPRQRPTRQAHANAKAIMALYGERNSVPVVPSYGATPTHFQRAIDLSVRQAATSPVEEKPFSTRTTSPQPAVVMPNTKPFSLPLKRKRMSSSVVVALSNSNGDDKSSPSSTTFKPIAASAAQSSSKQSASVEPASREDSDLSDDVHRSASLPAKRAKAASTMIRRLTTDLKDGSEKIGEKWQAVEPPLLYSLLSFLNNSSNSESVNILPNSNATGRLSPASLSTTPIRSLSPTVGSDGNSEDCSHSGRQRSCRSRTINSADMLSRLNHRPHLPKTNGWQGSTVCDVEMEVLSGRVRYSFLSLTHSKREPVTSGCNVIINGGKKRMPFVARLHCITQEEGEDIQLHLVWYYRPDDIPDYEYNAVSWNPAELFSSHHLDVNSAHCLLGRCYVTSVSNYNRYRTGRKRSTLGVSGKHRNRCVPSLTTKLATPARHLDGSVPPSTPLGKVYFCSFAYDHRTGKVRQRRDMDQRIAVHSR